MIRPFRGLLISCRFMRFDTFPPQVTIMAATNFEHGFSTFYSLQSSFIPVLFLCYTYSTIPKRALCHCLHFSPLFLHLHVFSPLHPQHDHCDGHLQKFSHGRRLALTTCTMHNMLFVQSTIALYPYIDTCLQLLLL